MPQDYKRDIALTAKWAAQALKDAEAERRRRAMTHKFGVGTYKTRDGSEAVVTRVDYEDTDYPLSGSVGGVREVWTDDGRYSTPNIGAHDFDLMPPSEPAPTPAEPEMSADDAVLREKAMQFAVSLINRGDIDEEETVIDVATSILAFLKGTSK